MRDFLRGWEVDGRPMNEWGFWNLLARGMSHEAYELARVTSGYDTAGLNWNAFDTISLNFDLARRRHVPPRCRAATSRCR